MLFNTTLSILSPLLSITSDVVSVEFNGSSLWVPRTTNKTASSYTATLDEKVFEFLNGTKVVDVGENLLNVTPAASNLLIPPAHTFTFQPAELVSEISWQSTVDADAVVPLSPDYLFTQFWKWGFSSGGQWVAGDCLTSDLTPPQCYTTSEADSYVQLKFKGDGITIHGNLENIGSGYSVSLDGAPYVSYSARNITSPTNTILAQWTNIGNTDHVVVLKNTPNTASPGRLQVTGIDLICYESDFNSLVIEDPVQKNKNTANTAAVGIGCTVGLVFLGSFLWLLKGWIVKRRRASAERAAANPRVANFLERDLEAAKSTFVTNWVNRPVENQTMTDRDSTTTSRPGSMHEKDGDKKPELDFKPSEYGEPIPPAFALQLKNIAKAEKELKSTQEATNGAPSRSWNPFKREKKDQA